MEKQVTSIALLKALIKLAANRARTLRTEIRRAPDVYTTCRLQQDLYSLTQDIRLKHLAYGFLRGTPYAEMERTSREAPYWKKVKKAVDSYGVRRNWSLPYKHSGEVLAEGREAQDARWEQWLEEAKAHFEENRIKV